MTERRITISPELDLAKTLAKARKLAQRIERKGMAGGFTVRIEDGPTEPDPTGPRDYAGNPTTFRTPRYLIIDGEPAALSGWSFVASVEWENGQPVVTGSPWYEGPQVDREALRPGACDECGVARMRGKVIVVENEAGERKQVGTTCVADFLGASLSPSWYSTKDPFAETFGGGGYSLGVGLRWVLTLAAASIRVEGFRPKSAPEGPYTSSTVADLLGWGSAKALAAAERRIGPILPEDEALALEALEFGRTMEGWSDYAQNVRAVFGSDEEYPVIPEKRLGLAVSVVGVLLKAKGQLAERKAVEKVEITEALYAEPGTKVNLAEAVVVRRVGFETAYGWSEIFTFVADGYRFRWFTSSSPDLAEGDRVSLKGTVKGVDVYNDQTSTALLRVKTTRLEEAAA